MALEFRTRDDNYKGPHMLSSKSTIRSASLFVDHLPAGFPTEHYKTYVVKDKYSYASRYVIDSTIMIGNRMLLLFSTPSNSIMQANPEDVDIIEYDSIGVAGLDILLMHDSHQYQGTVYAIPDDMTESLRQHHGRKRQR